MKPSAVAVLAAADLFNGQPLVAAQPVPVPAAAVAGEWLPHAKDKDLGGWMNAAGADSKWTAENGTLIWQRGASDIWTKARCGNLVLELERPLGVRNRDGYIGLQDHGTKVSHRNLRIMSLP